MAILSDAALLSLGIGIDALTGIDSEVREVHAVAASEWVLSFVRPRYAAALDAAYAGTPDLIEAAATRASYTIFAHRGVADRDPTYIIIRERLALVTAWLEEIRSGNVQLGEGPDRGGVIVQSAPRASGFTAAQRAAWYEWHRCGCRS